MTFDEYEKANADKMAALNSLNKYEEVVIEADDAVVLAPKAGAEDEFALIFHDSSMVRLIVFEIASCCHKFPQLVRPFSCMNL